MGDNVKISSKLFMALLRYHLFGDDTDIEFIKKELSDKLDSLVSHELYSQYKTTPTGEQKEKARQRYLNNRGISVKHNE